jgi:predicted enzyme related to lactoylglutathione lyase
MKRGGIMPTRDTPWPNGTPCWVDYGAADLDGAKAFYAALFGWEYTEGNDEEYGGYINALKNGQMAAGLGPRMDESQPVAWTTYVSTDDSEATARRITEAGGTIIVEPMDIAPYGRMTIALDPQGNAFGLWEAREHTGVRIYNEPGALAWNELMVADTAAAREFYGAVFGWTFQELGPEAGGPGDMDYTTFSLGENPLGGLGAAQEGMPTGWLTCFAVEVTDDAVATAESKGGKVTTPAMDTPFGRFAIIEDPWGAPLEVMGAVKG